MVSGTKHSFLGQTFDFGVKGECTVTVGGNTHDLLGMRASKKEGVTPATEDLFVVGSDAELLPTELRDVFHSVCAKAYYMALRTRSDVLTAAAFLVTQVQAPTVQDM